MKRHFLLITAMLFSIATAFAQGGTTGPLTWQLNGNTLTISGEGAMPDYGYNEAPWYEYRESIHTAVMEIGVTTIGNTAFYNCTDMTSITIPNSVTTIGDAAFRVCRSLTSITISSSITTIGERAFQRCGLTSIIIPSSVTTIGYAAFILCTSLTSINVENGNSAYTSENGVLFDKSKITLICYPPKKTANTYVIPGSVTTIGDMAFVECTNLTSITIPNSVTMIGSTAFYNCTSLTSITNLNPVPVEIDFTVFDNVDKNTCTLEVPIGSVSAYQNAEIWKEFNIVGIEVGIETIGAVAVKIYPNPTTGELKIENGWLRVENVIIYDVFGKIQKTENGKMGNAIDISHLPAGAYFVKISTEAGEVVRKVLKE